MDCGARGGICRAELTLIGEFGRESVSQERWKKVKPIEIMTGAPLPEGADAVVMIEHTTREGDRVKDRSHRETGRQFQSTRRRSARGRR
jgi:molybdopterin molybdotransferase